MRAQHTHSSRKRRALPHHLTLRPCCVCICACVYVCEQRRETNDRYVQEDGYSNSAEDTEAAAELVSSAADPHLLDRSALHSVGGGRRGLTVPMSQFVQSSSAPQAPSAAANTLKQSRLQLKSTHNTPHTPPNARTKHIDCTTQHYAAHHSVTRTARSLNTEHARH